MSWTQISLRFGHLYLLYVFNFSLVAGLKVKCEAYWTDKLKVPVSWIHKVLKVYLFHKHFIKFVYYSFIVQSSYKSVWEDFRRSEKPAAKLAHTHRTLYPWRFQHCKCFIQHCLNLFEPFEHTPSTILSPTNLAVTSICTSLFNDDYLYLTTPNNKLCCLNTDNIFFQDKICHISI